jgi:hypothetical protein
VRDRAAVKGHILKRDGQPLAVTFRWFPPSSWHRDSLRDATGEPNRRFARYTFEPLTTATGGIMLKTLHSSTKGGN